MAKRQRQGDRETETERQRHRDKNTKQKHWDPDWECIERKTDAERYWKKAFQQ